MTGSEPTQEFDWSSPPPEVAVAEAPVAPAAPPPSAKRGLLRR